ncbi:hypothetical protein IFM89_036731 [Coptis chinensis]|uniref:Uncharacterized protein n=1 Tax=Coptis chinensis TaxID=261450 RepID=A0A835I3F6_9MAGN|nr:hypothetical protein IFM89_036731 [Coptis chinensis]
MSMTERAPVLYGRGDKMTKNKERDSRELKQYPTLRVEVTNAGCGSLDRMRDESKKATLKLVDMESSYLTVEFFRKLPQDIEKGGNPTHSIFDRYKDSYLRQIKQEQLSRLMWELAELHPEVCCVLSSP